MRMQRLVQEVRVIAKFFRITDMEAMSLFFTDRERWAIEYVLFGD